MMQLSQVADSRYFQYLRRLIYIISNRLCFDEEIDHLLDMVSKFGYWRALKSILSIPAVATNSVCKRIIPNLILRGDFDLVDHIIKCHPSITQRYLTPGFQGKFYQLEICTKSQGNPYLVSESVLAASRSDFDGLDSRGSREGWPRRYSQKIAASTCIRSIFTECPPISSAAEAVTLLAGAIVSRKTNVDEILRIFDYRRAIDAVSQSFKDVYETVVVKFAFENTPDELDPTETFAILTMLDELGFWSQICLYLFTSSTDTALAESQRAALLEFVLFRNSQIFGGYDVLATNIHDIIQIPVDEIDALFYEALSARSSLLEHERTASEAQALFSECLGTVFTSSSNLMQLCTELLVSAYSHERTEVRDFLLNYYQHRYPETYQHILNLTFSLTLESTYLSDTVYNRPVIYLFRKPGTILSIWGHLLDIGAVPITLTVYENQANRLPQSILEQILLRGDLDLAQKLVRKVPSSFCNLHKDRMMDVLQIALQQSDSTIFTTLLPLRKDEVAIALLEHQNTKKRNIIINLQFQAAVSDCDIERIREMWESRAIYTAAPDSRQLTFVDNNINPEHAKLLSSLGALVRFYTPDNKKLIDSITKLAGSISLLPSIRHLFYNIRAVADNTGEIITEKINIIQALASIGDTALLKNIISAHLTEARELISAKYPFAPSPLICAIRLESLSCVKLLVQIGANLNDYEDLDCTYLIDDPDVQWGCPLDVWEVRERSPLSCATLIGNLAIVKYLLEHGAKPDKVCVETAVAYERLDTLSLFLNFDFRLQEFAMDYASSNLDPFEGDHILGFIKEFGSLKGKEVAPSEAVMGRPAIEEGEEERG